MCGHSANFFLCFGYGRWFTTAPPWNNCVIQSNISYMVTFGVYLTLVITGGCYLMMLIKCTSRKLINIIHCMPMITSPTIPLQKPTNDHRLSMVPAQQFSVPPKLQQHRISMEKLLVAVFLWYYISNVPQTVLINFYFATFRKKSTLQLWMRTMNSLAFIGNPLSRRALFNTWRTMTISMLHY